MKEKLNAKNIQCHAPIELAEWVIQEAKNMNISTSTQMILLINEARQAREMQVKVKAAIESVISLSPDQVTEALKKEMEHLQENRKALAP